EEYLKPVLAEQIDTLVLGCTHYPLLKPLFQSIVDKNVRLIDSAEAMAEIAADLIHRDNLGNDSRQLPDYLFYVSDVPYRYRTIGERVRGRTLARVAMIRL